MTMCPDQSKRPINLKGNTFQVAKKCPLPSEITAQLNTSQDPFRQAYKNLCQQNEGRNDAHYFCVWLIVSPEMLIISLHSSLMQKSHNLSTWLTLWSRDTSHPTLIYQRNETLSLHVNHDKVYWNWDRTEGRYYRYTENKIDQTNQVTTWPWESPLFLILEKHTAI